MRTGCAETNRAKNTGHERDVIITQIDISQLACLMQLSDHVEPKNVGLALFHTGRHIEHGRAHGATTVDSIFDTQAVRNFMEHRVSKKCIKRNVLAL